MIKSKLFHPALCTRREDAISTSIFRLVISVEIVCICGRDLTCEDVFNECLDKIRQTRTLWLPLANMYNPGLAKVDLAGKGKTRQGANGVAFVTGAYTDRF